MIETIMKGMMNIMASVYVLHHYEDFYALVDSAWTAAKMLVGEHYGG